MVETVQIGSDTRLIDPATGKLTRQGLLIMELITEIASGLDTHEATLAGTATLGHVLEGAAVTDANASNVVVSSADVTTTPASYSQAWGQGVETLANELKDDVGTVVTDLNNAITQLNALIASLENSGAIST